ncbi:MAG: hypothetical protein JNK79_07825 [Chitinophagaceae bacterium]|nr:hypothetical protein [Chitinophagaceae bacterium]
MDTTGQSNLDAIRDIRKIMERSSRFISLSGWSGIGAGLCAIIGAIVANRTMQQYYDADRNACFQCLVADLVLIASAVFVAALIVAFLFTYLKSRKDGVAIWGTAARRLLWNTMLPMVAGGIIIWKMLDLGYYELIVSSALVFYGLALVNGSKYTMGEVRYLGYAEIATGVISLFVISRGLYVWAFGFGVLHIVYGISMWWKYDRKTDQ